MHRPLTFLAHFVLLAAALLGCARPGGPVTGSSPAGAVAGQPEDTRPPDLVTEEPSPAQPVVVAAALRPTEVRPGDTLTLFVQVRIAPTWHIYAVDGSPGENIPTSLKLKVPEGVQPVGSWTYPQAKPAASGQGSHYEGTVTFRQQLRIAAGATPGPLAVTCEFDYQACDPFTCRPPAKLALKASAEVIAHD